MHDLCILFKYSLGCLCASSWIVRHSGSCRRPSAVPVAVQVLEGPAALQDLVHRQRRLRLLPRLSSAAGRPVQHSRQVRRETGPVLRHVEPQWRRASRTLPRYGTITISHASLTHHSCRSITLRVLSSMHVHAGGPYRDY